MNDLIDKVIEQIQEDLSWSDTTGIAALLSFVPEQNLIEFLPEELWDNYKKPETYEN